MMELKTVPSLKFGFRFHISDILSRRVNILRGVHGLPFWQQKQTKSILPAQLTEQENFTPIAERATDN